MRLLVLTIILSCFFARMSLSDVHYTEKGYGNITGIDLHISGEITSGTVIRFKHAVKHFTNSNKHYISTVILNSKGGNVEAALEIGRFLRDYEFGVWVHRNQVCFSSCVLIYVGAVRRHSYGTIGLHRPYFQIGPDDIEISSGDILRLYDNVRGYLEEMNIGERLFEIMMSTPPEDMTTFTGSKNKELLQLIPTEDAVYAELQVQERAREVGISTAQLRQRRQWAAANCRVEERSFMNCFSAEEWGLSISGYLQMRNEAERQCWKARNRFDCMNRLMRQELGRP